MYTWSLLHHVRYMEAFSKTSRAPPTKVLHYTQTWRCLWCDRKNEMTDSIASHLRKTYGNTSSLNLPVFSVTFQGGLTYSKTTQLRCGFGPCIQFWGYHGTSTTLRVNWRLEISPSLIIPIATRQFALNQFAKIKGLDWMLFGKL